MSYHGSNVGNASHYLSGDMVPPRLVARVLGEYGRYGTGLGIDKEALKVAKAEAYRAKMRGGAIIADNAARSVTVPAPKTVTKNAAGKVVVPTASLWTEWNHAAAQIMQPFRGLIDALPSNMFSSALKTRLKNTPLDVLLDIFDPIVDRVGRAVDRVMAKKGFTQNYFGKNKNLKRVQPNDTKADQVTQDLLFTLRTIEAFVVLFFTQPIDLAIEMGREGINIVADGAKAVGDVATKIAQDVGKVVSDVVKAGAEAAEDFVAWAGSLLGGLGSLGDGGATAAPPAVAATAVAGTGIEATIASVLAWIGTWIVAPLGTVAATNETIKQTTGVNLIDMGVDAVTSSFAPKSFSGGKAGSTSGPVKLGPADGGTTSSSGGSSSSSSPSSGGVPPLVIFGGAAALAFLLLQQKGSRK